MVDTHCHIDQYSNPLQIALECENLGIITIAVTNLPSHFAMGYQHLQNFSKVRLALGMHPLYSEVHDQEFPGFIRNLSKTSYIGEVGLDFSNEGITTKSKQQEIFSKILQELKGKKKLLSLHSRKAEKETLSYLMQYEIKLAIFHWYSGPISLIKDIVQAGYYFSINTAMIRSKNGQAVIAKIPLANLLTESDGPFIEVNNTPAKPTDIKLIHDYLSQKHNISASEIATIIRKNFKGIIMRLR